MDWQPQGSAPAWVVGDVIPPGQRIVVNALQRIVVNGRSLVINRRDVTWATGDLVPN